MAEVTAAVVRGGTVENLIVVDVDDDRKTTFELPGVDIVVLPDGAFADIGWAYDGSGFTAPAPAETAAPEEAP